MKQLVGIALLLLACICHVNGGREHGRRVIKIFPGNAISSLKDSLQPRNQGAKSKSNKNRIHIVKCCGVKSCRDGRKKKKMSSTDKKWNTAISSKNTSTIEDDDPVTDSPAHAETSKSLQDSEAPSDAGTSTEELPADGKTESPASTEPEAATSAAFHKTSLLTELSSMDGSSTNTPSWTTSLNSPAPTSTIVEITSTGLNSITTTSTTSTSTTTTSTTSTTSTSTTTTPCPLSMCASVTAANKSAATVVEMKNLEKMLVSNGTAYMASSQSLSFAGAAAYCFKKGMKLVPVDQETKFTSLVSLLKALSQSPKKYWTAGVVGRMISACLGSLTVVWCTSGGMSNSTWWASKLPALADADFGKAVGMSIEATSTLTLASENTEMPFVCEALRPNSCPSSCVPNNTFFYNNGTLKDTGKRGQWKKVCNSNYFFGSELVTWQESLERCCSLGMRPIWLKDETELKCLAREAINSSLNLNYWTGATQQGFWGQWSWCLTDGPEPLGPGVNWAQNQPDNANEACLHLRIHKNGTLPALSDRNCSAKYFLACKGNPVLPTECKKPLCPSTCDKNPSLFSDNDIITNKTKYGNWNTGCGKEYLFAKANLSYEEAHKFCCSIGMQLLSVDRLDMLDCITKISDPYPRMRYVWAMDREFWTSATNKGCPGKFEWCSKKIKLTDKEARWSPGHPAASEACVTVVLREAISGKNSSFSTAPCNEPKQFICEGTKRKSDSMQRSLECLEIWGLTDAELNTLLSASFGAATAPRHIKCYVRCMGLSYDLYDFASNQYGAIVLSLLEDASSDDDNTFQKGVDDFDQCRWKTVEDECTVSAEVYGCNNQKNPILTQTMVGLANSTSPQSNAMAAASKSSCVLTPFRRCPPVVSCTVDSAARNNLLSQGRDALGAINISPAGRRYYAGMKGQTYDQAAIECCVRGMRLAEITEEMFADFMNTQLYFNGYGFIGATFNDGDNSDRWCVSLAKVPTGLIKESDHAVVYDDCNLVGLSQRLAIENDRAVKMVAPETYPCGSFVCLDL